MFLKLLFKSPMLSLGILMLVTVALGANGFIPIFNNPKLKPTSCRAALVKIEKGIPQNWKVSCDDNNLTVLIRELQVKEDEKELKAALYRQMANYLVELARVSQNDILEKVFFVRMEIDHPKMTINALSEGKYVAKLATLTSPQFIMDHLKQTVQVKDVAK